MHTLIKNLGKESFLARFFFLLICLLGSCAISEKEGNLSLAFKKPTHFPEPTYTFRNNQVTEEGFKLGKRLFFDNNLSRDGSISCSSCHVQQRAFADIELHPFSIGVDDQEGIRNAPPLFNLAFHKEFFWDGGVTHLDFVPIQAIESPIEMDETMPNVIQKLNRHPEYPRLFKQAFGIDQVTGPYFLHALSQFMLMMVSAESRYDAWYLGQTDALSRDELQGLTLFRSKCENCHKEPLMTDLSYRNNGIQPTIRDEGRRLITEMDNDRGKFKVPSLRNIAVTAPYMHNARFTTLREVLDHYVDGVHDSPTLDPALRQSGNLGIPMTADEKEKIILFLNTLTDEKFLKNSIFHQR